MNQDLVTTLNHPVDLRFQIDWPLLQEQRQAVLAHCDIPAYCLKPEIHTLIDAAHHDNVRLMMATLWHTGARISECLALTPGSFHLEGRQPYVSIKTLKKRGRPKKEGRDKPRFVPITDLKFITQCQRYFKTHGIKQTQRIFEFTRDAANKRLTRLIKELDDDQKPIIKVTPHTFRHSFAVHAILHGTPLPALQKWLGHEHLESTLIYTEVLTLDTWHLMNRIEF